MKMMIAVISVLLAAVLMCSGLSAGAVTVSEETGAEKLNEELIIALKAMDEDDELTVSVWLAHSPDFEFGLDGETLEEIHALRAEKIRLYKEFYTEKNTECAELICETADAEVTYMSTLSPLLTLKTTAGEVEKIASVDGVAMIMLDYGEPAIEPVEVTTKLEDKFELWMWQKKRYSKYDPGIDYSSIDPAELNPMMYGGYKELINGEGWTLIHIDDMSLVETPWEQPYNLEFAGRVLAGKTGADDSKRAYPYYLYDAKKGTFCNIYEADPAKYVGIAEALAENKIGRAMGDADGDGRLNLMDATRIQRSLVNLDVIDEENDMYWCGDLHGGMKRYSDADGDGKLTIMDATRIQRTILGMDEIAVGIPGKR